MTHLICEVAPGLRSSEATVTVRDYAGRSEYFPADRGILAQSDGKQLLPVRVIFQDERKNAALIELPNETDSGSSRIWVKLADLMLEETVP